MRIVVIVVAVALQMMSHHGKTIMVVPTLMVGRADCQQWEQRHCIG